MAGPFATAHGSTGVAPNGLATFADPIQGMQATDALVQHYANQGFDINALINKWAPPNAPGNSPLSTQNYVNAVAGAVGASPSTPLSATSGQPSNATSNTSSSTTNYLTAVACEFGFASDAACKDYNAYQAQNPNQQNNAFSFGRIAAFLLGLILIAGGIFLLKESK